MFIGAAELNIAGLTPGYTAQGQETSNGLVTLDKIPDAPAVPALSIKPPVLAKAAAEAALVKNIAQQPAVKKNGLKEKAHAWTKKRPYLASLYRRPQLRRYASLDGSAREAKRIIEEAKKNPALLKRIDPRSNLRQALKAKADAPRPGRIPRFYHALRDVHTLVPSAKPVGAPTKVISLKQMAFRTATVLAKMAGVAPSLPLAPAMRRRPLLAPGVA